MKSISVPLAILIVLSSLNAWGSVSEKQKLFIDVSPPLSIVNCVEKKLPRTDAVYQAAISYARSQPDSIDRFKKNIKRATYLPRLELGYERRVVENVNLNVDDSVSVSNSGVGIGPSVSNWKQASDQNNNVTVKAVWYLDELIFNRDELSIENEARSQLAARRDILNEVDHDLSELKRMISLGAMKGGRVMSSRGAIRLEINRLIGRIDSLTGGRFGHDLNIEEIKCEEK